MSTTIDNKVVEMRFDNKQFEAATSQSMSTIDKLTSKLKFTGAAKGLQDIDSAAKKVNMSGLGTAVDAVSARFSALQVMGVTALANITNSAVNAGKRMISALTIDPIKTGFQEYETQINAIQTILANTQKEGTNVKQVNAALDELNAYADKTIYNFTEMTRNIGTFTAAGVDLNTSVNAIQGIANLAAVSGSNSQQASVAMYQLSQALASGTVKLMDWNSVVNAGMGGQVFQDALKETSELLGTGAEAAIKAQGSFRESLTTGWLTSEVLTETLKKFTTSGANEYVAKYTGLSKEAVEAALKEAEARYGEADAIDKAAEALAKKSGKNKEEIKDALQFAKTAEDAATKVKTFTQLWDVLKEAAQSGWAQTWRLIIGDFEEAKSIFTPLSDFFTGIINKMSDARNDLLESALGMGFDKLQKTISKALGPIEKVVDGAKEVSGNIDKVTESLESLDVIVDEVILGKFGNGKERFDKLTESGQNFYKVQNKVNETLGDSFRYSEEQIAAQDKIIAGQTKQTEQTEKTEKATKNLTKAQKNQLKKLAKMTEEQALANGCTKEQIAALKELNATAEKLGMPLDEFIDKMDQINGRWLLLNSFKNIGEAIGKVFGSIGKAFRDVFDPIKPEQLFNAIAALHKFTAEMIISDATAEKLRSTFKGVFAIVDILSRILGGGLRIAFTVVSSVLKVFGLTALDATAGIGELIYKFNEWLKAHDPIIKVVEFLAEKIPPLVEKAREFIQALWVDSGAAENFHKVAEGLQSIWSVLHSKFMLSLNTGLKILNTILAGFGTNMGEVLGFIAGYIAKAVEWIAANTMVIGTIDKIANILSLLITGIAKCVKAFLGLEPVQKLIESVKNAFKKLLDLFDFDFNGGAISSLYDWLEKVFTNLEKWISNLGSSDTFQKGLNIVEGLAQGIAAGAGKAVDAIKNVAKMIIDAFCSILGIHSPSVVFIALGSFIVLGLIKGLVDGWGSLWSVVKSLGRGILDGFTDILQNGFPFVINLVKTIGSKLVEAFQGWDLDFGSLIIVGVIVSFLIMFNKLVKVLDKAVSPLSAISGFFNKLGDNLQGYFKAKALNEKAEALRNLALAIALLAGAFYLLAQLEWAQIARGAVALVAVAGGMAILAGVASKVNTIELGKVGLFMLGFAASMLIMAKAMRIIAAIPANDAKTATIAMLGVMAGMAGILAVFGLLVKNEKTAAEISRVGNMFIKMSVAMLLMAKAIEMIADIPVDDLKKSGIVLGGIVAIFAAFALLGKMAKYSNDIGTMMMKMAAAIIIMAVAIRMLAAIPNGDIVKGLLVIAGIQLIFTQIVIASMFAGEHASRAGSMMLKMAFAIGILAMVMKLIATMSYDDIAKGLVLIAGVEALFAAFILASRLAKNADKTGMMIFKMAAGMALMGVAIKIIAGIPLGDIIKGIAVIAAMEVLFGAMVVLSHFSGKYTDKAGSMMIKMSAAILILVAAIAIMAMLDPKDVLVGTACISALLICFAAIVAAAGLIGDAQKELIIIAATVALLVAAIVGLTFIDQGKVIAASASLSAVLGMMALLVGVSKFAGKVDKSIFLLLGVVAGLGAILYLLGDLPVKSAIGTAAALSILLLSMAAALVILNFVSPNAAEGLAGIAILSLVVAGLAFVLGLLEKFDIATSIATCTALSILLLSMSAALVILNSVTPFAAIGLVALAMLVPVMLRMALVLGVLEKLDVTPSIETAVALSTLMIALSYVTVILSGVGLLAPAAIAGAYAFTAVVGILGGLMVAIGALVKYIPAVEEFLNRGIAVLELIGQGIGRFIGGIIGGLAAGALSTLPELATQLSTFMENLQPFIAGAKSIDDTVLKGVGILTGCILALTAANWIENIASFIQFGSSFENLGTQLSNFAINAAPFFNMVSLFTPDMFEGIKYLSDAILEITSANLINSISNFIPFSSSLAQFGESLVYLGIGIKGFATAIGTLSDDQVKSIKSAGQAIKELAKAGSEINGQADWAKKLFGDNSLGAFAKQLPLVGAALSQFVFNLGTFSPDQVETVKCAGKAIKALAEAGSEIEARGGWADKLFGDDSLGSFAIQLPLVGQALKLFVANLGTITPEQVESVKCAGQAIKALAEAGSGINGQAEWAKKLFGDNGLGAFSDQLPTVATNLSAFVTNLGVMSEESIASVRSAVNVIKALATLNGTDLSNLITYLPAVGDKLVAFGDDLVDFCNKVGELSGDKVANVTSNLLTAINDSISAVTDSAPKMEEAGQGLGQALANGIKSKKDAVKKQAEGLITAASDAITGKRKSFREAGSKLGTSLKNGLNDKKETVTTAGEDLADAGKRGARSKRSDFRSAGEYLGQGLINGMNAKKQAAYDAGYALGQKAAAGVKAGSKERSPSKLTYQYGIWQGEGLINGITDMVKKAYNAGYNLGDTAARSMTSAVAKVSDLLNGDMNLQPTIRPVVDLSEVEAGAGAINGMFGMTPSVGVMSNLSAINTAMNRRNQNGGTEEVVSAIDKLRKDLGNVGNTTYSIEGINYNNGDDVATALETIVRAAKVERRI